MSLGMAVRRVGARKKEISLAGQQLLSIMKVLCAKEKCVMVASFCKYRIGLKLIYSYLQEEITWWKIL